MMRWRKVAEGVVGLCIALYTLSAHALYLDSTIYDIPAERSFISKRIKCKDKAFLEELQGIIAKKLK